MTFLSRSAFLLLITSAGLRLVSPAHAAPDTLFEAPIEAPTSTWSLAESHALPAAPESPRLIDPASMPLSSSVTRGIRGTMGQLYKNTDNGFLDREARFVSGTGNLIFLAAGILSPLAEGGREGRQRALRVTDSVLTSTVIAGTLKSLVHEKRPDSLCRNSFPSGHTTAAFAVATMQADYHPKQALLWYGGATIIAASRLQLNRHYVQDVMAGAAVSYFTSRLELRSRHGLLLRPFISEREPRSMRADRGAIGLSIGGTF